MEFPLYYGYLTTEEIDTNAGVWTCEVYSTAKARAKAMRKKVNRHYKEWGNIHLPSWKRNNDWLVFKFRQDDKNPPRIIRTYNVDDLLASRRDFRVEVWLLKPDPSTGSKSYTQYYLTEMRKLTEFEADDIIARYASKYGTESSTHRMRVRILGKYQTSTEEFTELYISESDYDELVEVMCWNNAFGYSYSGLED